MSYEFQHDEPVATGFRRVAVEEFERALDDLTDQIDDDPAEAVHDCRKRCKKIRGLVRLVRPAIGEARYDAVNGAARDAARELSSLRDAAALHESFGVLVSSSATSEQPPVVDEVEQILASRRAAVDGELGADHSAIVRARDVLVGLRGHIDDAATDIVDEWPSIGRGLQKTYGRARHSMRDAGRDPSGEAFHDWRKRTKYTWYHARLLSPAWPSVLAAIADDLDRLSDALGDAHDMLVLGEWLRSDDPVVERLRGDEDALELIDDTRRLLERRALRLGAHVFAEPKRRFADRIGRHWEQWRAEGPLDPTGGLEVVVGAN